jgi:inosine/xanthosine triphosphatase
MKIHVGSKNRTKVRAVEDALLLYPQLFPKPEIKGIAVNVPLFGHPKNIEETVTGAITRAKEAFIDCDYSFGIEGGLMAVPFTEHGFMEVGVCALYDGENVHLGLSPAFEWPKQVTELILSNQADASQAFKRLGLTKEEKLGAESGGIIGFLTDNKVTREDCTKSAIIMAIIRLEKPYLYKKIIINS